MKLHVNESKVHMKDNLIELLCLSLEDSDFLIQVLNNSATLEYILHQRATFNK